MRAYLVRLTIWASFSAVWLYPDAAPAERCEQPVAQVVSVQGTVESQRLGATQWQGVRLNDPYCAGDQLRVQERSRADVALMNQSVLRLSANTTLTFESTPEERTSVVSLLKGLAHFFSRSPHRLEVRTSSTAAGVRGTEFVIGAEPDQTLLTIYEGTVVASNPAGSLTLTGGQSAIAESGKAPVRRVVARPRDAVHWALYYPPVLYTSPEQWQTGVDWQRRVGASVAFYLQG
jgi:ferric-dicitrate binding protein FerR (iron transport regulator)